MRFILVMITLIIFITMSYADTKLIKHEDNEFGYSFLYPSDWTKKTKPVPSGKLVIVYSKTTPKLTCQVVATKLDYINSVDFITDYTKKNPLTKQSWYERFKPTSEVLNIIQNKQVMIAGIIAEQAVFENTNSVPHYGKLYGKYLANFMNTPGKTWNIMCSVMGISKEKVTNSYSLNGSRLKGILSTLKFN